MYFLLSDHLGSTSVSADVSGGNVTKQLYKGWGEIRYTSGSLPTKYQYTGQYSNMGDFGLMFYNARWFDPALARFSSADTIIPGAGNPAAWDRYAGMLNNPLRYRDPSGHATCDEDGNCFDTNGRKAISMKYSVPKKGRPEDIFVEDLFWPTDGGIISTKFGAPNTLVKNATYEHDGAHPGVDIVKANSDDSDDIYADYDGIIVDVSDHGDHNGGLRITIEHNVNGKRFYSYYFHLASFSPDIEVGTKNPCRRSNRSNGGYWNPKRQQAFTFRSSKSSRI